MKKLITVMTIVGLLQACVEDYKAEYPIKKRILIVEGSITDQPIDQFVSLQLAEPNFDEVKTSSVLEAIVEVLVNNKDKIKLIDKNKEGKYYFPNGFKPQINTNYKLQIITKEGIKYESSNEMMTASPKIDDLNVVFEEEGLPKGNDVKDPAHFIYLDTKDPEGIKNNYFWNWKVWEKQQICLTCPRSYYRLNTRTRVWECNDPRDPPPNDFDYPCGVPCWEIYYNDKLNVLNDVYFEGKPLKDRLVAKIPFLQRDGALVEITQQCVSESGFRFLRLLIQQGQNTGTLADTPPAALVGNIKNINDEKELVGGIFMVSGTETKLLWLDRKDVPRESRPPKGLLGREPNLEDVGRVNNMPIPPCINSKNKTNIKPIGWRD
jgi:hypothetical protein